MRYRYFRYRRCLRHGCVFDGVTQDFLVVSLLEVGLQFYGCPDDPDDWTLRLIAERKRFVADRYIDGAVTLLRMYLSLGRAS